jgi:methionyl-tRNA synthetase
MSKKPDTFYISTPIYYVNDQPHIGHAYTTILADVLAQYHRLLDVPTHFLTGTDEHGQKVQQAADKKGISPQEQCDQTVVRFQELWKRLDIQHDDFIRTTEPRHKQVVQAVLQELFDRDEIYRAEYDGWYDVSSETFITEKELDALVKESVHATPEEIPTLTRISEANYFFRMGKYQEQLIDHIEANPTFIQPAHRRNETLGFLKNKTLQDLCISRPKSRLAWGIELPFDAEFVTYVWFDALINYISAIGYKTDDEAFKRWWPCSTHLIGKDILTTHTVYWPTMLMAMQVELPKSIFAHGWWLTGRTKMSKSLGNVVDPMEMIDRYGVDAFRYYLIAEMTLGQDASFTEEAFARRYNADLANDLGNLASRVLAMMDRYCEGKIPAIMHDDEDERRVWRGIQQGVEAMQQSVEEMRLDSGIEAIMNGVRGVNRYLEVKAPWTMHKQGNSESVSTTLRMAAECLRVSAVLLYPVMPERMQVLLAAFGVAYDKGQLHQLSEREVLDSGRKITPIASLFPRVEVMKTEKSMAHPPVKKEKKMDSEETGLISFEQVMAVEMKVATLLEADPIDGADKLLKLKVDLGDEQRQIVAGIAQHYRCEDLIGKRVVVVVNLKPAKLRGVRSEGMLLAASSEDHLTLVTVEGEIPSGASVK